jgi:hypothetical protein
MEALGDSDVETDFVYAGLADKREIRAVAAHATASSKRSKRNKKKRRRITETPTNSNQIYDRIAQNGLIRMENGIEPANNQTIGINTQFPGFLRAFGMQMCGVSTPPRNGQIPKD